MLNMLNIKESFYRYNFDLIPENELNTFSEKVLLYSISMNNDNIIINPSFDDECYVNFKDLHIVDSDFKHIELFVFHDLYDFLSSGEGILSRDPSNLSNRKKLRYLQDFLDDQTQEERTNYLKNEDEFYGYADPWDAIMYYSLDLDEKESENIIIRYKKWQEDTDFHKKFNAIQPTFH